jgi:hypothetical protein
LVVSESATLSVTGVGGAGAVELRQPARDWGSHSPNHGVEDDDCCGGGRVNKGPACCTGKPYWGAVKKACDVDQFEAPPMDGQAGCIENPYWPMDGQTDAPTTVPARASRAYDGACGGASDDCGGLGAIDAHDNACGDANGGGNDQGAGGARGGASRGVRAGCDEGRVGRWVGACGDGGAHGAYGGGCDDDGVEAGRWRSSHGKDTGRSGSRPEQEIRSVGLDLGQDDAIGPDLGWASATRSRGAIVWIWASLVQLV